MNTLKRKLTAILLTFAMLFSLMPALPQAAEAATVQGNAGYVTLSYDNDGWQDRTITVNVMLADQQVDTIVVKDAKAARNQLSITVDNLEYELNGENAVSVDKDAAISSDSVAANFRSWSGLFTGNDITITVNLREKQDRPLTPEGIYKGYAEYRLYGLQTMKLLYGENVAVTENTSISRVQLNFEKSFLGYGDNEELVPEGESGIDYRWTGLVYDGGNGSPTNIESVTIQYGNGEEKTISADKLRFVLHTDKAVPYYTIEARDDSVHVLYFYNEENGLSHYTPYAVRFVNHGETLKDMPADPEYNASSFEFVNWTIGGTKTEFTEYTVVDRDMEIYAEKVSSAGSGGTEIHVMNPNDEFLNRLVELYNAEHDTNITVDDIDRDTMDMSVTATDGTTTTNKDYYDNKWKNYDGVFYYYVNNFDADYGAGTGQNTHVPFNDVAVLNVYFIVKNGQQQLITIPINSQPGNMGKVLTNVDTVIELSVNDPPLVPTEDQLEDPETGILKDGAVEVSCTTNTEHDNATYGLLPESYDVSEKAYWANINGEKAYYVDVTVENDSYVEKYNETHSDHTITGAETQTITLKWTDSAWTPITETPVTFEVTCENEEPTKPENPNDETVKDLLKEAVKVQCDNESATHKDRTGKIYGLIEKGYTLAEKVTGDADDGYTYTVTIQPDAYVLQYSTDTKVDHDLDLADQENKTITLEWTGTEWQVAEDSIPVTITVHCDSEEPTPTTPEKPDADDLNDLLDVVLDCASNVGHADETYKDLLENSYDIGDVTRNDEGAYTVGVTIDSDKYIADYSNNVIKVAHEIQDGKPATKTVTLTYDEDNETWTTTGSPVEFLIVCKGVDWDISNIEKDLVTEVTLGAAKTNGVSDDALKNITVPENTNDTVIIPEDGSVTLLYAITVNGKAGIAFSVEDPETTLVKSSANVSVDENADVATYTGLIPVNGTVTFYVSKNFIVDNITENGQLVNSATVAGDDGTTVNPGTEDDPANKDDEVIDGEEEDNRPTPPPYIPGGDDDDNPGDNDGPSGLNTEDHFSYVVGYEDGMVKPQRSITRAEVATIFYRLLEDDVRDDYDTTRNNFSDVTSDSWYNQTVSTLASMGILKGYEDGTFRPNASITRAEFAAIATRFFEETGATYEPGTFTDVTGDEWFAGAIMDAVNLGLIGGYEDGTVRPNNNITRAEACAIVNRTLGRVPDADHLLPADEMTTWPDNPSSAWFYADMQEATNGHEYEWITEDGNKIEEWTDILDKDWNDR